MLHFLRLKKKDSYTAALELKKRIPALEKTNVDYVEHCLRSSNLIFYHGERVKSPFWIRLTVIPAFVFMVLLVLLSPINYILTGYWGYRWLWLSNWFRAIGF